MRGVRWGSFFFLFLLQYENKNEWYNIILKVSVAKYVGNGSSGIALIHLISFQLPWVIAFFFPADNLF